MKLKTLWGNPFLKNKNTIDSDIDFITEIPLFYNIKKRGLSKIYPLFYIRHYKKNEVVFRQEDSGVGLYIIRSGGIAVYKEYDDLVKKEIAVLGVGDFFGEISLLNESFRSATVVATTDTVLFGLFKPEFLGLMESDPKLGQLLIFNIAQILAERLRLSSENS